MTAVDQTNPLTLVTGASGFVGNTLVRHLISQNRRVRVLVREETESLRGLPVEYVLGNITDLEFVFQAVQDVSLVYHLAATVSINPHLDRDSMFQTNVRGTQNVVRACLQSGIQRLIHFSSIHALSYLPKQQPIDEGRNLAIEQSIHDPYDFSKAHGELAVLEGVANGLDAVILNPVGILGPYDFQPSPSGEFVWQLMNGRLPGLVRAGYYWVDVRDVAAAAIAAETHGRTGQRYILKAQYARFSTIAQWVSESTGINPPWINAPVWLARCAIPLVYYYSRWRQQSLLINASSLAIVTRHQRIESDKAIDELGFRPRPLQQTVRDTVRWLKSWSTSHH